MKKIKKNKKEIHVAYPVFSKKDIAFVQKKVPIILNGRLSTGPFTKKFEKEFSKFIGTKYAVFLNSCTSALEISLRYLNLKKNDEVIVPTQSFIADGSCVVANNAKVIFANINKETFCLDFNEIKKRYTKKTKAIILVHFGGYMPHDIEKIKNFCKKRKIFLLEDCSHSIGSQFKYLKSGSVGDCGCFSFFSTKTITTGEGGMITTNNKKIYEFALAMRDRGRKINYPFEIYDKIWRNCRVPELSALVGLSQFRNIKKINSHRAKIVEVYNNYCKNSDHLETLPLKKNSKLSIWKHIVLIKNNKIKREILQKNLKLNYNININWAYYPLLHRQPIFKKNFNFKNNHLKKTENLCNKHFHLPLHMNISLKDAHYVISALDLSIKKLLNE